MIQKLKFRALYVRIIGKYFYDPFSQKMIDKKIIFIHIPKTGGTSVATSLVGKPSGHPYLYEYYYANKTYTKEFFKFCVVRNPFDRLVSGFFHIKHNYTNPIYKSTFNELKINTFDDLILCLEIKKTRLILVNNIIHFRSQHELINHKKVKMDKIYKYEEFDSIIEDLNKRLDENLTFEHLNSSPRKGYKEYYNERAISICRKIYQKDLETFNYEF